MRCFALGICGCLALMLGLPGCAGEKSDGAGLSAPPEVVAAPAEDGDDGPIDGLAPADAVPETAAGPDLEMLEPTSEMMATDAPSTPPVVSPLSPAAANDWPKFAPRHLPADISLKSATRAPTQAPTVDEAMPAPTASPATRSAESVEHVDEIVSRLDYGTVGFYTPTELPWGETLVQEVVLSPKDTPEQLRTAMSNPTAPAQFSRLQVASRMEAKLSGSGFDIEPLSEPLQAITSHRPTKWRFKLTPVKTGPQELHLSLLAHIDVDGRDAPLVVETKDALIEVDITVPQRIAGMVQAHWKWLWAAVVVPTIGYFWRRKTGRKPPEEPVRRARAA